MDESWYQGIGTIGPWKYSTYEEFSENVKEVGTKIEGAVINHTLVRAYRKKGKLLADIKFNIMVDSRTPDKDFESIRKGLEKNLKIKMKLNRLY